MNVYAESNFVLELALAQEQHDSCERILALCEADRAQLLIPAFSIAEPYQTLHRRHAQRRRIRHELDTELVQLARTARDFDDPDLVAELARRGCKMLPRFDSGYQYITAALSDPDSGLE